MAGPGFVHLHVHSSYSLLEGALTIARLAELAKADHQPALALTDTDNMFGALEFSEKLAGSGVQPIVGCALAVDFGDQDSGARHNVAAAPVRQRIVLLAAREAGYRSLMRLNSRAFLETPPNESPHIKLAWLEGEAEGLIALTGGPGGPLDAAIVAGNGALAAARCDALTRLFGDRLYIELQRHGLESERLAEPVLVELAYAKGIPLVGTNEPYFATREDYEAHDALISIAEGRLVADTDRRQLTRRAPIQDPRRDGGACSPTCRKRSRPPSRLRGAAPTVRGRWRRSCRAFRSARTTRPWTRRRSCAGRRPTGSTVGWPCTGSRPGAPPRSTASGSTSSSASSSG